MKFSQKIGAALALTGAYVGSAMADVPTAVTEAFTEGAADVATLGGALVLVALAGIGFMLGIKYLKKVPRVG